MAASKAKVEVIVPEDIELLVVFWGLQLCVPMGIIKLIIESDCLLMVRDLQASAKSSSSLGILL